tara:strand:+ start:330 stop:2927 length:2598 start_codon:yes stop_codon:yes gene_type:complete
MAKSNVKPQPIPPIQETMYVDCNREFSMSKEDIHNNSWDYKLNQDIYLPKGTQISLDNTFLNLKGITGGSIEIEEDVLERVDLGFYVTESPHFNPTASYTGETLPECQFRATLGVNPNVFSEDVGASGGNLGDIGEDGSLVLWMGEQATSPNTDTGKKGQFKDIAFTDFQKAKYPYFTAYGGCGQLLMMGDFEPQAFTGPGNQANTTFKYIPTTQSVFIYIPRGIYGVSQLATWIEDFFLGNHIVVNSSGISLNDPTAETDNIDLLLRDGIEVLSQNDFQYRMNRVAENMVATESRRTYAGDGLPINRPLLRKCHMATDRACNQFNDSVDRSEDSLALDNINYFVTMDKFNTLMAYATDIDTSFTPPRQRRLDTADWSADSRLRGEFSLEGMRGEFSTNVNGNIPNCAMFNFIPSYDFGTDYLNDDGSKATSGTADTALDIQYNLYTSNFVSTADDNKTLKFLETSRYVGTSNFSFSYNTDTNGFKIAGLHNNLTGFSHDTQGNKNSNSGKKIVRLKKVKNTLFGARHFSIMNGDDVTDEDGEPSKTKRCLSKRRAGIIRALNRPETRDSGVMIFNWARYTAQKLGNRFGDLKLNTNHYTRFSDYFDSEKKAREAWATTIWFRLGFKYEQLADPTKYEETPIWDSPQQEKNGQHWGFTTDEKLDNSYLSSVSTLNNPLNVPANVHTSGNVAFSGLQAPSLIGTASTTQIFGTKGLNGMYTNSIYRECLAYEIEISDTGGVVAKNLPTLTKHSYFLITSDILDSYKDNVKAGDPIPLLGVVPKSNLSNQDFIVAQNQIVQTLTMDKIVNKIKITILNPNLTPPFLDEFSSVILKIVRPNTIPPSLAFVGQEQPQPPLIQDEDDENE